MSRAVNNGSSGRQASSPWRSYFTSPVVLLALAFAGVCALLALPLSLPIGPLYWDVYMYYDAANRIYDGQAPILDFFPSIGPLGHYLFAGWLALFPEGQPALMVHWSTLVITAPLMALVLWDVQQRSRSVALMLLVPFLIFALVPFNTREFFPVTGSDAFAAYNRQLSHLLYIILTALIFVRSQRVLAVVVTLALVAIFFLKITGIVAAGIIVAYAFVSGRLAWRYALASAVAFLAVLGLLEIATGIVSAYLNVVLALIEKNSDSLFSRLLYSASLNIGALVSTCALAALLLWSDRAELQEKVARVIREPSFAGVADLLNEKALWLGVVVFAGILLETQNTGGQALIYLWPLVLAVLLDVAAKQPRSPQVIMVAILAAAISLPPAFAITERAARVYVGGAKNMPLESHNLKTLGRVTMRAEIARRADLMLGFYPKYRAFYDEMAAAGETPSQIFYSEFDFQIDYLVAIDRAVDAIRALETANGIRFETIGALNYLNPFPWLMDRKAPKYVAIAADPFRTMPPTPGPKEETAMAQSDLVLYNGCPPTKESVAIVDFYKKAMVNHKHMKLDACYDAYIHPKFGDIRQ